MAFTLDVLAQELGIDPETLKAKSEVVSKWNGYLTKADEQYTEAKRDLEQAKRDQQAIDEQITKFGVTEARLAELQASNAAYAAALEEVKKQGMNVNIPTPPPAKVDTPDPVKTVDSLMRSNFANMGAAMQVQTTYQAVYGKPFSDDPVKLIDEATAARMPVAQYAEQKYKFTEARQKADAEARQREIQAGIDSGVKKWQEDHPVEKGNPSLAKGLASQHPKVFKPRDAADAKSFRNLPPRERIAASVLRVREAMASNSE